MKQKNAHPLRIARTQRRLTMNKLAEELKIGSATIWRAEHDQPISAESRRRICAYFGMTSQELGLLKHLCPSNSTHST